MCREGTCAKCRKEFARDRSRSRRWDKTDNGGSGTDSSEVKTNFLNFTLIRELLRKATEGKEGGKNNKEEG